MKTLKELLQPRTRVELREKMLALLYGQGYGPNDFVVGSEQRTLIEVEAQAQAELSALAPMIAAGGFLKTAAGDWLDLLAESKYDLTRAPSTFARYSLTLTASAASGPYTVAPGQLWASSANGRRFSNVDGGTLTRGGALALEFQAEEPGAAYNLPDASITTLITALPGVSVTNLAGSLIAAGANTESDDSLRRRCRLRWAQLGAGTRAWYENAALAARDAVEQVLVLDEHPRGQGTVDVVVWGDGGIGTADVEAVRAYILAKERKQVAADVAVYGATPRVVRLEGSVIVAASWRAEAEAAIVTGIAGLARETGIGQPVYRSVLFDTLVDRGLGISNVTLTSPAGDVVLGPTEAVVFDLALGYAEV